MRHYSFYLIGLLSLSLSLSVHGQITTADKAQTLLQEVQNREQERIREAKIREVERLNEDLSKDQKEAESLELSIEPMKGAVTDASNRLAQLNARKKQFAKMTEVLNLQIDAESLKAEGLKMLAEAQAKSAESIRKRIEQTQVRKEVEAAKMMPANTKLRGEEAEKAALAIERKFDRADRAAGSAKADAREAMTAATNKLAAARTADEKARARAKELGIPIPSDPVPSQETVEPLKEIDPLQTENAPIALPVTPEQ